ncbi:four helix bundle protein [Pseudotenacibaculum haliotis]|uniref:Four helix bundle protein n=1 Tax=Pseudotenacibaculum haliotis TaxID=1862138 RepID=A0ABW5LTL0_9FLAO
MIKHNFKKLKIWHKAMELCKGIFRITDKFPKSELYSLTSQMNRSAVSVPSNIAEGSSRSSEKEFKRYLEISMGSLFELQTQIMLSNYKGYLNEEKLESIEKQTEELQKMISGFMKSL